MSKCDNSGALTVQQTRQAVGIGLQVSFGHHPQQPDPGSGQLGQGFHIARRGFREILVLVGGRMNDPDRSTHDRDRHAQCGHRTFGSTAQLGTRIEFFAVSEALHLGPTRGGAVIRRVDLTPCGGCG